MAASRRSVPVGPVSSARLFTAKVRIALAEKGLAYDRIEVDWNRRDRYLPQHPDVVAINPEGQMPCLGDRHPAPALMPREPAARGRCRLLELEADEVLFPHVWTLIDSRFYPGGHPSQGEHAAAGAVAYQARLAAALGDREFLCEQFSVADIGNAVMLSAASSPGVPVSPSLTTLAAWTERVAARPAVAEEMAAMSRAAAEAMAS